MFRKITSSILIIILLTLVMPIEQVSHAVSEYIEHKIEEKNIEIESGRQIASATQINARIGVTTIDITGLATGGSLGCKHNWNSKYNSTHHWEICILCNETRNRVEHNLVVDDVNKINNCSGSVNPAIQKCSCGYQFLLDIN